MEKILLFLEPTFSIVERTCPFPEIDAESPDMTALIPEKTYPIPDDELLFLESTLL